MNLAQCIDPERALSEASAQHPGAPAPTMRVHFLTAPRDLSLANDTQLKVMMHLATQSRAMTTVRVAQALGVSVQKASEALHVLASRGEVIRTNTRRPYVYAIAKKGVQHAADA